MSPLSPCPKCPAAPGKRAKRPTLYPVAGALVYRCKCGLQGPLRESAVNAALAWNAMVRELEAGSATGTVRP